MKILVLDLETTGLTKKDVVVEIGLILVDTETKKIEVVFDEIVRHEDFNKKLHKDGWIFQFSDLTVKEVMAAEPLDKYKPEIQALLDEYVITAFNKAFDLRHFKALGFTYKEIKCLMHSSTQYCNLKNKRGHKKPPSVQEAYDIFFPDEDYIETHRAGDDALHEGKILLRLCELKEEAEKKHGKQQTLNFG